MARIGLMVVGNGERHTECRHYDDCLRVAALANVAAHCSTRCAFRSDVSAVERVAEHLDGLRESPNLEAEGDDEDAKTARGALKAAVLASLADGPKTTRRIATATGFQMSSLTGRMADFARAGLIRRVGTVRETARSSATSVVWERA